MSFPVVVGSETFVPKIFYPRVVEIFLNHGFGLVVGLIVADYNFKVAISLVEHAVECLLKIFRAASLILKFSPL